MKTYEIEQTEMAVVLWTGEAESEQAAAGLLLVGSSPALNLHAEPA